MTTRTIRGAKNWYPTEDLVKKNPPQAQNPAKLRSSLVPGTILIILAGRFRGKRVVYLKPLEDNTLLVSGPFKVNGVPLRRVNARYVIATSTRINVSGVDAKKFGVAYFTREKKAKDAVTEEEFFGDKEGKKEVKAERVADQKEVDAVILAELKKQPLLKKYIAATFSLKNGDKPHLLKF